MAEATTFELKDDQSNLLDVVSEGAVGARWHQPAIAAIVIPGKGILDVSTALVNPKKSFDYHSEDVKGAAVGEIFGRFTSFVTWEDLPGEAEARGGGWAGVFVINFWRKGKLIGRFAGFGLDAGGLRAPTGRFTVT